SKSATESRPPESATASLDPLGTCSANDRPSAAVMREKACAGATDGSSRRLRPSARNHLLELAITKDLVLTRFDHRIERLLLQVAQRFDERLLERHHHRCM